MKRQAENLEELTPEQEKLFTDHLYLVQNAIKGKWSFMYDDAQSIAFEALLRTVRNYDPSRGSSLSNLFNTSFNFLIINEYLKRLREKGRDVQDERELQNELKELNNLLSDSTDTSVKQEILEQIKDIKGQLDSLKSREPLSLDMELSDGEGETFTLKDTIPAMNEMRAHDYSDYVKLKQDLKKVLDPTEFAIMEMIEQGYSYQEIFNELSSYSKNKFRKDKAQPNKYEDFKGKKLDVKWIAQIDGIVRTKIRPKVTEYFNKLKRETIVARYKNSLNKR